MEGLIIILGGVGVVAFSLCVWSYTKEGKKWIASL